MAPNKLPENFPGKAQEPGKAPVRKDHLKSGHLAAGSVKFFLSGMNDASNHWKNFSFERSDQSKLPALRFFVFL